MPIAPARSTPKIPSSAAPRKIPTPSSRREKRSARSTPKCRESSTARWRALRHSPGGATSCSNMRARPTPNAFSSLMGSGAETARETVKVLAARGEKVGVLQVRLYRPFSAAHFLRRAAAVGQRHRGPRTDQGTRRRRGASLPRRRRHPRPGLWIRTAIVDAAHHRWTIRTVLEGFYAGDGQGSPR